MNSHSRPAFRFAALTLLGIAGLLTSAVPSADAARRFDPNSVKGKWTGTYLSDGGDQSGAVSLTVTKVKFPQGSLTGMASGTIKLGAAKGKMTGFYGSNNRELVGSNMARRGTVASISVVLSQDGTMLTGRYGTTTVPDGSNNVEGTVTLNRR